MSLKITFKDKVKVIFVDFSNQYEYAAKDLILFLEHKGFEYLEYTYIPKREEKFYFYELYKNKINKLLLSRNLEEAMGFIKEGWTTKKVLWNRQEVILSVHYDQLILKLMILYEVFNESRFEDTETYFDFFDYNNLYYQGHMHVESIIKYLIENSEIPMLDFENAFQTARGELMKIIQILIRYGLASVCDDKIFLSERGKRILK